VRPASRLSRSSRTFVFGEVAEKNPDYNAGAVRASGSAAARNGVADLVREEVTEKNVTVRKRERWYIERAPPPEVLRSCKRWRGARTSGMGST